MPTLNEVKTAIDGIKTDGTNRATTVREVLNLILEHGAVNPPQNGGDSNLQTFSFSNDKFLVAETNNLTIKPATIKTLKITPNAGELKYSFRGIHKHSVNLTFLLQFNADAGNKNDYNFFFKLPEALTKILIDGIFVVREQTLKVDPDRNGEVQEVSLKISTPLSFTVPISTEQEHLKIIILFFEDYFAILNLSPNQIENRKELRIHTSLQLHSGTNISVQEAMGE